MLKKENPVFPSIQRISLLNVPIDIFHREHFDLVIQKIPHFKENRQILLLSFSGFIAAKLSRKRRKRYEEAALIFPYSRILIRGIRFLFRENPDHYYPFNFIISLLTSLEKEQQSVYLLGEKRKTLQKAHKNIKDSFPYLKIVGRYYGYFPRQEEQNILLAIKKAQPAILLAGRGIAGKSAWLEKNRSALKPGLFLYYRNWYQIITGKRKRIPLQKIPRFLYYFREFLLHPWRIWLFPAYLLYNLLLFAQKIRG